MTLHDWRALVLDHARSTGAPDLPLHAADELAAHLEDLYQGARGRGLSQEEAHRLALAALAAAPLAGLRGSRRRLADPVPPGTPAFARTPPLRSLSMMHAVRLSLRQFRLQRAFAVVTTLVLGLGIGASVTVYSIIDSVLLTPLPYRQPDRLITWWDTNAERGLSHEPLSPVNFMDYRALDAFEDAAAWWRPDVNLTDPGLDPVRVNAIETGANLFELLGVAPRLGPGFPADGPLFHPTELIAAISDRLWRTRYSADPSLIGRTLEFNGAPYTIVGIMPPGFRFPDDVDVWQRSRWDFTQHSRGAHFMETVARLAPGVPFEQADAAMTGLAQRLAADYPQTNSGWSVRPSWLLDDSLGYYRPALIVLFGAVGLLMIIATFNVASLLLTRALARQRELAVRTALGASPRHLVTQLFIEALALSLAGAAAGVLATLVALPLITAWTPVEIPRLAAVTLNYRVMGFAALLAVGATLLFGLVPALGVVRRLPGADLKAGERGSSRAIRLTYRTLVAGEVALAAALLVGAGLLIRTVVRMTDVPTGVTNGQAVVASIQLTGSAYPWLNVAETYGRIVDRLREQPGVRAAGATNFLPYEAGWRVNFTIEGQPAARLEEQPRAQFISVMDGYFESIGARMAAGRPFTPRDDRAGLRTENNQIVSPAELADIPGAVIVNQAFADRFLGSSNPLTAMLQTTATGIGPLGINLVRPSRFAVVGVVADIRNVPVGQAVEPAIYFSGRQFPFRSMFITIDAEAHDAAVTALQRTLREVAPAVPMAGVTTWHERVRARSSEPRLLMTLLVFFGALAGLLAALGVYGLFVWMVALRRRELAIRLTLGARPSRIGLSVVMQGAALAVAGLAIGVGLVQLSRDALARVLFGVSATDVGSTGAAALVLLVAALVACLPAAIRAMRVNPIDGLRTE